MLNASCRHECSDVGLAELLEALDLLKPRSNRTCALIAEALGLGWSGVDECESSGLEESLLPAPDVPNKIAEDVTPDLNAHMNSSRSEILQDSPKEILNPVDQQSQIFEILFDPILESTEALKPTNVAFRMGKPRYQSLLHDRWFCGIISAMLATPKSSQEIDWAVLERELVRGQLLDRLPFRQRPTLQRGVMLILDRSESMQPFWRDEEELLGRLVRLLGESKVQVWWLKVDRWRPDGPRLKWYTPLPHQFLEATPLLLVSDFGVSGELSGCRTNLKPWLPLIDLARRAFCPLVALIPAAEIYWPSMLKQYIPYPLVWDRGTSIASVRRYRHRIR